MPLQHALGVRGVRRRRAKLSRMAAVCGGGYPAVCGACGAPEEQERSGRPWLPLDCVAAALPAHGLPGLALPGPALPGPRSASRLRMIGRQRLQRCKRSVPDGGRDGEVKNL